MPEASLGYEKIVQQILADAGQAGEGRMAEAEQKAAELIEEARRTAAEQAETVLREGKAEQESMLRAAHSAAALTVRNARLRQRRQELDEALAATLAYLAALPAEEYFQRLYCLLEKSVQPGEGVLRLNQRDLSRLPADFSEKINAVLRERGLTGGVTVSDEPAAVDGGFLLQYGDIEINASFSALAEEKREALEDLFNRELFEEPGV